MKRSDFQLLARTRIKEAEVLLTNRCYDGAYYLAGYAVECALKACFAKQISRHEFPDKKRVDDSYSHDLAKLIRLTKLESELINEISLNNIFYDNWLVVKNWSENSRYQKIAADEAKRLYTAISDHNHGVLPWLQKFW